MEINRRTIHQQIFRYGCLLIAVFLPVYGMVLPPVIAILVLNWLVEGNYLTSFRRVFSDKSRWITLSLSVFYLLYVVGLLYTSNFEYAFFDLEVKFSLLIFPLIIATSGSDLLEQLNIEEILTFYVGGCLLSMMLFLTNATVNYIQEHSVSVFYYERLSWYFHPGYLSMYYVFALAILINFFLKNLNRINYFRKFFIVLMIIFFEIVVFLLSSKAGILSMLFVFAFLIIARTLNSRNYFRGIILFGASLLLVWGTAVIFPVGFDRLKTASQVASHEGPVDNKESTALRLTIWKAAGEIIQQHVWFGVGTGDVKDELINQYKSNKDPDVLKRKLNAHSQFLQTFIAIGIPGILFLLAMILIPGWISLWRGDYIYFLFLAIFAFNILVESMFEVQAGVIFFAFFNTLLFRTLIKDQVKIDDR